MDDETRIAIRKLEEETRALAASVTRLVKELEHDNDLREKELEHDARMRKRAAQLDDLEDQQQNERYEQITEALKELQQRVETSGRRMRDMPALLLQTVEKKIYELRTARWEAKQVGIEDESEPPPLPPPPAYREQTGRIKVQREPQEDLALTPYQQKKLAAIVVKAWHAVRWPALGGGIVAAFEWIRHLIANLRH